MEEDQNKGTIKIANEVISIIAGLAATEVEGVAGMSGGIAGGIAEILGRKNKNLSKGVKVEAGDRQTAVDLSVIIDYGFSIKDVAIEIQDNVKEAIESMTGLNVVEINVHVQGVHFEEENEEEEEETEEEEKTTLK